MEHRLVTIVALLHMKIINDKDKLEKWKHTADMVVKLHVRGLEMTYFDWIM